MSNNLNSEHHESSKTCRVCASSYSHEHHPSAFGICEHCAYKVLILLVVVMVAISYIAWFGIV